MRPDLSIQSLKNLCIEIRKPRTKPFLIATWCKPPSSSTEIFSYLETLIGKLDSENAEFDLMGDFNCNFASSQPDNNTVLLSNLSDVYGLHQLIGRDPFNQNSNRSDREKWSTSKGGPVFSKLFRLDRTDPLSFGPKFSEILVEWIAPINTPTGVKSASSTLTDVIFTNYLDRVVCSSVSHVSLSDHSLVYVFREVSIDPSILL